MRTQVRRILSGSSSHLSMLRRSSGVRPSSPRSAGVLETWWKRLVPSISRVSKLAPVDFAGAPRPVGPAVAIELPYTLPEAYVSRNGRTKFNTVAGKCPVIEGIRARRVEPIPDRHDRARDRSMP